MHLFDVVAIIFAYQGFLSKCLGELKWSSGVVFEVTAQVFPRRNRKSACLLQRHPGLRWTFGYRQNVSNIPQVRDIDLVIFKPCFTIYWSRRYFHFLLLCRVVEWKDNSASYSSLRCFDIPQHATQSPSSEP